MTVCGKERVNVIDEDESKQIIVHENLSQKNSADVSEYTMTELNNKEYKEPAATKEVKRYFNIFKCGRNPLNQLDVTYQRAFMATPQDEYYTEMLKI